MDKFLAALLCGFVTGISCLLLQVYPDESKNSNSQWPTVGFLSGLIGGFTLLVFLLVKFTAK